MSLTNTYALVIGVGDYRHNSFGDLPATVKDAETIADALKDPNRCAYPTDQVKLITSENAMADSIRDALQQLAKTTDEESTVLFYFSGHGGRAQENGQWTEYLCPCEADASQLASSAISGAEFSTLIAAIPAKKQLIIIDACHAAGSASLKAGANWKAGLPGDFYAKLVQGSGRVVIASSKAEQSSYVREQGDLSVFTWHLRDALEGKAAVRESGMVHVLDIFSYVSEAVRKEEPRQTPILKADDLDSNFPVALVLGGKGTVVSEQSSSTPTPIASTWLKPHEVTLTGQAKIKFCHRLLDSWKELAMILDIPAHGQAKFEKGDEARAILVWLESRQQLDRLPAALEAIDRDDLVEVLTNPP